MSDPINPTREQILDIAAHLMRRQLGQISVSLSREHPTHSLGYEDACALAEMAFDAWNACVTTEDASARKRGEAPKD